MSGQGQVKGHNETMFSPFGISGRLDGLGRGQTHSKCLIDIRKGYCISTKGIFTKGQGQVTKGHYKIKVTNMQCDTSFLGHFARNIDGDSL